MTQLLQLDGVSIRFPLSRTHQIQAVDSVSFSIAPGEAVALVGESGCGKSTLARAINRLIPAQGRILLDGRDIARIPPTAFARDPARPAIQMVFQDATDSLDPHLTAQAAIAAPIQSLLRLGRAATAARVREAATLAGLPPDLLPRYPHQLSGGQKARVNIARALGPAPRLLVLDEPTSALDVSVQATVLRLFADLQSRLGVALLFISHDLNVVRLLCNRILVMVQGQVVEQGPAAAVFTTPRHPFTQALIDAIPNPARRGRPLPLETEPGTTPATKACPFAPRCPLVQPLCHTDRPSLRPIAPAQQVACHQA